MVKTPLVSSRRLERKKNSQAFVLLVVELGSVLLLNALLSSSTTLSKGSFFVSFLELSKTSFGTTVKQALFDLLTTLNLMKVWLTCRSSSFLPTSVILKVPYRVTSSLPTKRGSWCWRRTAVLYVLSWKHGKEALESTPYVFPSQFWS